MSIHRLVALVSTTVLVGLLSAAQATNFAKPEVKRPSVVVEKGLREKVQSADIDGCG